LPTLSSGRCRAIRSRATVLSLDFRLRTNPDCAAGGSSPHARCERGVNKLEPAATRKLPSPMQMAKLVRTALDEPECLPSPRRSCWVSSAAVSFARASRPYPYARYGSGAALLLMIVTVDLLTTPETFRQIADVGAPRGAWLLQEAAQSAQDSHQRTEAGCRQRCDGARCLTHPTDATEIGVVTLGTGQSSAVFCEY
jgi:hypothetical protein